VAVDEGIDTLSSSGDAGWVFVGPAHVESLLFLDRTTGLLEHFVVVENVAV